MYSVRACRAPECELTLEVIRVNILSAHGDYAGSIHCEECDG